MSSLTQEQVLALAPDPASASSGRELSNPAKWESAGRNEAAVWGEAKGSGKNPYQTAVDLNALAYKCSCPSRKIPCKHALGLLLRLANGEIANTDPPARVTDCAFACTPDQFPELMAKAIKGQRIEMPPVSRK